MDDVADLIQDPAETITSALRRAQHDGRKSRVLTELSVKCCERLRDAVKLLSKLVDPATAEAALKTCEEIDRLESDADRVLRSAMSKLFGEEDVRELIKLKAIYELLETITDKCEGRGQRDRGHRPRKFLIPGASGSFPWIPYKLPCGSWCCWWRWPSCSTS